MLARLATPVLMLALACGCQQPQRHADAAGGGERYRDRLPPMLARMQASYPDLHTGRFISLADFNTRPQAELFRTLGPDETETPDQPTISLQRSVDQTGAGGLCARLASPHHRLVFDGAKSKELALIRDWRAYNILLVNIYGPDSGLRLEFSIQSGTDLPLRTTRSVFAQPGWNLYRFDLAEIGDEIDLADVRALTWRAHDLVSPVDLYLDDLILADNTRYLQGKNAGPGKLYVVTRGRRIHVGAHGRFELAFCDGVIVEWTGDAADNLTVRSGLGPWPVPLPEDWSHRRADPVVYDDPALFAGWGTRVATSQRLVERSEFRVVVEGAWQFLNTPGTGGATGADDDIPRHSWRYAIYPSGQVYVRVGSFARNAGWRAPRAGYAVALNGRSGFVRVAPQTAYPPGPGATFVLMAQPGRERPDLFWCPRIPRAAERQLQLVSADERRVAIMTGDIEPADTVDTAHLLRFWPRDLDAAPEALSMALDYQQPATLDLVRGELCTTAEGDLDRDGFNESDGCYELLPRDGVLRFRFLPGAALRHSPIFRIRVTPGVECWVYVDGRIVRDLGRDQAGNVLFTLPRAVSTPISIDVNTQPRPTSS